MKRLLLITLLSVAHFANGSEPLPTEIPPLSLGSKTPSAVAVEGSSKPFKGWSFDNEMSVGTASDMWRRFLPNVSVEDPRAIVSLFRKQVAEIQLLVQTDKSLETSKSVERELTTRYGKPRVFRLREMEDSCPSELVRKWTDGSVTLVLVSSEDYGAVSVVVRLNKLAKDISSWKETYYSNVLEKEPCVRW